MRRCMITLIAAWLLLLFPSWTEASYTSWEDESYPFSDAKVIYIDELDTSEASMVSPSMERKLKGDFYRRALKVKNVEVKAAKPEPLKAALPSKGEGNSAEVIGKEAEHTIVPEEAVSEKADIYILSRLRTWNVDSYLVPGHTEWRDTEVRDAWRDKDGNWHTYYRTVTYPEWIPPHYIPYAEVAVTFEWYDVKTGDLIASSEDERLRSGEDNPMGVYQRIMDRFFKNMKNRMERKGK